MDNILFVAAVVPGLFIIWWLYSRDVYEPEPLGAIGLAVAAGMGSAIVAGMVHPLYLGDVAAMEQLSTMDAMLIGVVEEGVKLGAVLLCFYRSPLFNEPADGIIYTCAVALGFAILENIGYVAMGGLMTAKVRALTAIPLHAGASGLMGYGIARAKFGGGLSYLVGGYVAAAVIHGVYDLVAVNAGPAPGLIGCIAIALTLLLVVHLLLSRSLAASPFRPLSERFRMVRNYGGKAYLLRCRACGTRFGWRVSAYVECTGTGTCYNRYEFEVPISATSSTAGPAPDA